MCALANHFPPRTTVIIWLIHPVFETLWKTIIPQFKISLMNFKSVIVNTFPGFGINQCFFTCKVMFPFRIYCNIYLYGEYSLAFNYSKLLKDLNRMNPHETWKKEILFVLVSHTDCPCFMIKYHFCLNISQYVFPLM